MAWECAECNEPEHGSFVVDAVCHHCGKPLCQKDQIIIYDDAFSAEDGPIDRKASHCRECQRHYHPGAVAISR